MRADIFPRHFYRFAKWAGASAVIIAAALSLNGCRSEAQAQTAPAIPNALVEAPQVQDVPIVHTVPGYVEAVERVELHPRVSGYLEKVMFEEGAFVKAGQVLFVIDQRPYQAALARAEAVLQQAKINAAMAKSDSERAANLIFNKAISKEEAQRRHTAAKVAHAQVAAAQAAVDVARLDFQFTEIRAPISGRIGRAEVTAGNLVDASDRLGVLVATNPLYIRFTIDENTFAAHSGHHSPRWEMTFDLPKGKSTQGEIVFVDNEVNASTGTVNVRAKIANHEARYKPGQYGTVALTLRHQQDAILVSEQAIGTQQGQRYVLVLAENNVLAFQPVTLGVRVGNLRVIEQGLQKEDRIVTNGLMRLRPGMTVNPQSTHDHVASLK